MQSDTNASNSRLTVSRMYLGIPRYEPPLSSAARSSALKNRVPNFASGKAEDLPPPGGPATTIIRGGISRQSHDPALPAYPEASLCEYGDPRHRRCPLAASVAQRPLHFERLRRSRDPAFASVCLLGDWGVS